MTIIMDGRSVAKETEETLKLRVNKIQEERGFVPILATILVGEDPASATYVRMKGNACERVGMKSIKVELPETTTTDEILDKISLSGYESLTQNEKDFLYKSGKN